MRGGGRVEGLCYFLVLIENLYVVRVVAFGNADPTCVVMCTDASDTKVCHVV